MKKWISLLISILLVSACCTALFACSKKKEETETDPYPQLTVDVLYQGLQAYGFDSIEQRGATGAPGCDAYLLTDDEDLGGSVNAFHFSKPSQAQSYADTVRRSQDQYKDYVSSEDVMGIVSFGCWAMYGLSQEELEALRDYLIAFKA